MLKEFEVNIKGVLGTFAVPPSVDNPNHLAEGDAPASKRAVLILHGQSGHRNYCYQRDLAEALGKQLGLYTLRIDFRGCGSSADNDDPFLGRTLDQDMEDIQACAEYLVSGNNEVGIKFSIASIVSHLRGSTAMLLWALLQLEPQHENHQRPEDWLPIKVESLVNCSSRFDLAAIAKRFPLFDLSFDMMPQYCLRHGKWQEVMVTRHELLSQAQTELEDLKYLDPSVPVLSIYGLEDRVLEPTDPAGMANALSRGPGTHNIYLIPDADHNFQGIHPIETEVDSEEYNPDNLPLNRKKLVNYNSVVVEHILNYLGPDARAQRSSELCGNVSTIPRWKQVDGVSNFRDIGGWRITNPARQLSHVPPNSFYYVQPGFAYRAANMSSITSEGLATMRNLRIKVVFDLRSDSECQHDGIASDLELVGITRVHAPVYANDNFLPEAIAMRYSNLMSSWHTFVKVYQDMLKFGVSAFRTIFEHVRDKGTSFVVHCSAGKDRTGIIVMLMLLLTGLDKNTIAQEYELTTIGLKPDHERIQEKFLFTVEKFKKKVENANELLAKGRLGWTIEKDGFDNLISSRYEAMLNTIDQFHEDYGSVENYMKEHLGFNDEDLVKIYNNLVTVLANPGGADASSRAKF